MAKTEKLYVRTSAELKSKLEFVSRIERRTISNCAEIAIEAYIKEKMKSFKKDTEGYYYIDFCTGTGNEKVDTLEEAKKIAEEDCAYTQKSVNIIYNGEIIATLPWIQGSPGDDDIVIASFGDFGYYGDWITESRYSENF